MLITWFGYRSNRLQTGWQVRGAFDEPQRRVYWEETENEKMG